MPAYGVRNHVFPGSLGSPGLQSLFEIAFFSAPFAETGIP